jgi:hypothetical protein
MTRPTFSLRDLCWLVLVVWIGCAWWVDRRPLARSASEAKRLQWRVESLEDILEKEAFDVRSTRIDDSEELTVRHKSGLPRYESRT